MERQMSIIDDIIHCEINFPCDFSNVTERPYGFLYHNEGIPDSYDSNHARILCAQGERLTEAVADVVAFYRGKSLTPRVYHLSQGGHGRLLRVALSHVGFQVADDNNIFFVHCQEPKVDYSANREVRRVKTMSPELAAMVERSDGTRARKVMQRCMESSNYHLLVCFDAGEPVAMGSLQYQGGLSRVDDVLTDVQHRGKGYARILIHYMVQYHRNVLRNTLYLYAENPTAIRIYREMGFVEIDEKLECWSAWQERSSGLCG
jgi:GNAT superfamily N-acetyltransferase